MFSTFAYFNLLFTLGMGVGIMVYGFNEAAFLNQYPEVHNPIGLTINHWIVIPWAFYVTFAIFEIYDQKYNLLPNWLRTIKTYVYGLLMMLGIGTSFALGVITISGALENIYGINIPSYALVVLLGALVTISLLRGIHKGARSVAGPKREDEINLSNVSFDLKKFASFSMILLYIFMAIMIFYAPSCTFKNGIDAVGSFFSDFFCCKHIFSSIYCFIILFFTYCNR